MKDAMIYDHPDFEPNPMNPSEMLHEIIDLARQCYERKLAYVHIEINANANIAVTVTTEIDIIVYEFVGGFHISPKKWDEVERLECRYDDARYLNRIIIKLKAIVGGA